MAPKRIGIIGGSGLYRIEGVSVKKEVRLRTPFGRPSDSFLLCEAAGREVVFLPRHGRRHTLLPSELPFRANIYGLKKLGVEWIISVSAVGSMKEHIHPRDLVLPHQFIDRTRRREDSFFGKGMVAHVALADPICTVLSSVLAQAARQCGARVHEGGTYLCMEGPAFSTRAESQLYRSWGVDVIGMTNLPEAKLAREAEICYATMAFATDYDCWHQTAESVTAEMVLENLRQNIGLAQRILLAAVPAIPLQRTCPCARALENAIVTAGRSIPAETRKELRLIIGKYVR